MVNEHADQGKPGIEPTEPEDTFSQFNPVHFTCGHEHRPTSAKVTHQVVAMWSPSLVQEDFPSATDFHTLPSLLCISSAGRTGRGGQAREVDMGVVQARQESQCFMVLSRQTKTLKTSSHSQCPSIHRQTHRGRVSVKEHRPARLNKSGRCVCLH